MASPPIQHKKHGKFVEEKHCSCPHDPKPNDSKVDEVANKKNQHERHGKFVKEKRCPCLDDSQLYAIKVSKIVCGKRPSIARSCAFSSLIMLCPFLLAVLLDVLAVHTFFFVDWEKAERARRRFKLDSVVLLIFAIPLTIYVLVYFCLFFFTSWTMATQLEVLYKCSTCNYEAHKTYEILDTKFTEWGRYTKLSKPQERISVRVTAYGDIERTFRRTRKDTGCFGGTNKWTNDLIKRLGGQCERPDLPRIQQGSSSFKKDKNDLDRVISEWCRAINDINGVEFDHQSPNVFSINFIQ